MRTALISTLACEVLLLMGCIQHSRVEQRVVELPAGYPTSRFDTAAQIGQALIGGGLGAGVRKQFPILTQHQLQGIYLTWNEGVFQGKHSVYFLTGIRYTGVLPEGKAVADYCESQVRKAVITKIITPTDVRKLDFPGGGPALVMEYQTAIPIANLAELRKEADWIWEAFSVDVENAKLTNGVIRATHPEASGLLTQSNGYTFVFVKRADGKWYCLQDEKK